jgi:Concanavalin A-like lectin/glucanases superfamily
MSWTRRRSIRPAAARALAVGVLAAGIAAPASANAGVLDSVAGWWPMYEGSGQVVHDLSGHGNNGMLGTTPGADANDPTWIRGLLFSSGLRFDGNDLVRIPDGAALNTTTVTASAWVRASQSPGAFKYVLGKGATSQCRSSDYGLYTGADGGLKFYTLDAATRDTFHMSGAALPADVWNGRWHFVAGTFDGTTAKLFVDGRLIAGGGDVPVGIAQTPTITGDLGLADYLGDCDLFYTGDIDEVAVFNQALPIDKYWSALSLLFSRPLR